MLTSLPALPAGRVCLRGGGASDQPVAALPAPSAGVQGTALMEDSSHGGQRGLPATPGPEIRVAGGTSVLALTSARRSPHAMGESGVPIPPSASLPWLLGHCPGRSSALP